MTRHIARKIHALSIVVSFFAMVTVLSSATAVAQVKSAGLANSDSSSSFATAVESLPESGSVQTKSGSVISGNSLFGMASSYAIGHDVGTAEFVAVADVNGDGNPDLVVAGQSCAGGCSGGGKVSVLLAKSNGRGFQAPVVYDSGGQWCSSVAVGDVNGDGKPDLVVTNSLGKSGGSVGVLLGNGDGTFRPAVMVGTVGRADSVVIADVNGDGKPDLIVAVDTSHVEVFLGKGDGTFRPGVPYKASGARSVALADLKHDGKLDLVVAGANDGRSSGDSSTGMVSVLLGNGDGTFQPAVTYDSGVSSGGWANSVATADFNGDGRLDLVVANYPDRTVGVLLGNGDGTFQPVTLFDSGANLAASVAADDLNGDGKADIVVGDSKDGVSLLLGNGDGTFQPATMLNRGAGASSVAIADMNRDGRLDIVTSNVLSDGSPNRPLVSVLLNTGSDLAATTTTVTSNFNPSIFGPVTFTAVVTSTSGTPTGTVIFYDGSTQIRSSALANGSVSMSTSSLMVGSHSITAAYQGSTAFASSTSAILTQVVNSDPTTTTLVSSVNPSTVGESVTFTATVTAPYGTPFGYLVFDGIPGTPKMLVNGSLSVTTSALQMGTSYITAAYQGSRSGSYAPSTSAELKQVVTGGLSATTTTLAASKNPAIIDQFVTFTATVTSQSNNPLTGTVTFQNGSTSSIKTLSGNQASYRALFRQQGSDVVTAAYSGDANNASSTGAFNETIEYATQMSVATSGSPSLIGQPVSFTATVSASQEVPNGELVTFYDGKTMLESIPLSNGTATYSSSSLSVGTHSIRATYPGDATMFAPSSAVRTQAVTKYPTTTVLASSPNPSSSGQAITFTATVASSGPSPTGHVVFRDGTTTLGSAALSGNVASLSKSTLAAGSHSITAEYEGDSDSATSTSATLNQVVNP